MNGSTDQRERDADFSKLNGDHASETESASGEGAQEEPAAATEQADGDVLQLRAELQETRESYLRALADLENYKKRAIRERSELQKYQGEPIFREIIEIVDNLELALEHAEADPASLREGVRLIYKMFTDVLGKWEVRGESSVGKPFDPSRHNAISRVPTSDTASGTVLNELKKFYFYKDRLLRPAEVVVAVEPAPAEEPATEGESSSGDE